jgi:hypothetical protein
LRHRTDGPAVELFYPNGTLEKATWYQDGWCHRLDGLAHEHFGKSGKRTAAEYWLNSKQLTKMEHQRHVAMLKLAHQTANTKEVLL